MRMVDLIIKKRDGHELTDEEISFWIDGYVKGEIPDYQSSAMQMAILFQGMNNRVKGPLAYKVPEAGLGQPARVQCSVPWTSSGH